MTWEISYVFWETSVSIKCMAALDTCYRTTGTSVSDLELSIFLFTLINTIVLELNIAFLKATKIKASQFIVLYGLLDIAFLIR